MADEKRDTPRPFDVRTVEYLLKLMTEHGLSEVDLTEGDQRIRLRKGTTIPAGFLPPMPYPANPSPGTNSTSPVYAPTTPSGPNPSPPVTPAKKLIEIKSPMVGTFYSKPKPDKPDYVSIGSTIRPDTVVCLIEAMKLYNDIKAEVSGTIAEVCINNGDFVEYNQVMFRVEPA